MIGAATLEGNKSGRMRWRLGKPGTCGARVKIPIGCEGNVTGETGFMRDFIDYEKGDKCTDVAKANWAPLRTETI